MTGQKTGLIAFNTFMTHYNMKTKKCERCSSMFKVYPSSIKKGAKWCSLECMRSDKAEKKVSGTRFYQIWSDMKRRCNTPHRENYKYYGAKGISYCKEWKRFSAFKKDMWDGYSENMTIDRIDPSKGYYKDNCQWITIGEQNKKHSRCRFITYKNKTFTIAEWARVLRIRPDTLRMRLERGWTIEQALMTKTNDNPDAWLRNVKITYNNL